MREGQHRSRWQAIMSIYGSTAQGGFTQTKGAYPQDLCHPIGNIAHAKAEANFSAALKTEDIAAYLTSIPLLQTRFGSVWPASSDLIATDAILGERPSVLS